MRIKICWWSWMCIVTALMPLVMTAIGVLYVHSNPVVQYKYGMERATSTVLVLCTGSYHWHSCWRLLDASVSLSCINLTCSWTVVWESQKTWTSLGMISWSRGLGVGIEDANGGFPPLRSHFVQAKIWCLIAVWSLATLHPISKDHMSNRRYFRSGGWCARNW
jgi:hypothetical protein